MSTFVAALSQNVRLRPRKNGRFAVLIITAPPGWQPRSPHSLPPSIEACRYLIRGCRCSEACIVAQGFNMATTGQERAVVVSSAYGVPGDQ